MHNHTFLFRERIWSINGLFYTNDSGAGGTPCDGMIKITHKPNIWLNEGILKIHSEIAWEHVNFFEIIPFQPGYDFSTFQSMNTIMGNLHGKIMVIQNAIITSFSSENSIFTGVETLVKIDNENYNDYGYVFMEDKKLGSWAISLHGI
ncbi:MAG: hypothetical protein M0R21_02835 [Lentimicrobiaceae bacterium]|nr:hypothetical protein [Lentimicrobiaceae bacterium]